MNGFQVIEFIAWQARAVMLKYMSAETCIISTRIVSQLISDLTDFACQPLPVSAVALNDKGKAMALEGVKLNEILESEDGFAAICKHLGEGADKPGEWWGGHLTMVVNGDVFVDASADQFTFPGQVRTEGPIIARLPDTEAFLDGGENVAFDVAEGGIVYMAESADLSYRESMDWQEPVPGDKLYDYVAEAVSGLYDLYRDIDMPEIPRPVLPQSVSRRTSSPETLQARERRAVRELGYTKEELSARNRREELRDLERRKKHGKGFVLHSTESGRDPKRERELLEQLWVGLDPTVDPTTGHPRQVP